MTPSVAPNRPRWRRHVPMLAFLLALAILIVAAARPQKTVAVPVERASIMLITDVSGSMQATDVAPDAPGRRAHRRQALRGAACPRRSTSASWRSAASRACWPRRRATASRIDQALDQLTARGGTGTGEAITAATNILKRQPGVQRQAPAVGDRPALRRRRDRQASIRSPPRRPRASCASRSTPSPSARAQGTITVPRPGGQGGTETRPVPPDPQSLAEVAQASGGKTFTAADAEQAHRRLQEPGLAPGHQEREAPDHGGLRRRRPRPAPPRRRACPCAGSAA